MTTATCALCIALLTAQDPHAGHDMQSMNDHMNDDPFSYLVLFDNLEYRDVDAGATFAWDVEAWAGGDTNRLYLRSEGEQVDGDGDEATAELLWARPVSRWWNVAAGIRGDFEPGDSRTWLAIGVFGLAPYRLHVQATAYLGESGRTALRFKTDYDFLLTNRLILQPRLQLDAYGKDDSARGIASGISSLDVGLRLRYEVRREFAPYRGVLWVNRFGSEDLNQLQALAGLRIWF
jgi:copper resistance protein B